MDPAEYDHITRLLQSLETEWATASVSTTVEKQHLWIAVGRPLGVLPVDWPGLPYREETGELPHWVITRNGLVNVSSPLSLIHRWMQQTGVISLPLLKDHYLGEGYGKDQADSLVYGVSHAMTELASLGLALAVPAEYADKDDLDTFSAHLRTIKLVPTSAGLGIMSPRQAHMIAEDLHAPSVVICDPAQPSMIMKWLNKDGGSVILSMDKVGYALWAAVHSNNTMKAAIDALHNHWGNTLYVDMLECSRWIWSLTANHAAYLL